MSDVPIEFHSWPAGEEGAHRSFLRYRKLVHYG